jgi:endo-1,4-beta-D-glucanase Y
MPVWDGGRAIDVAMSADLDTPEGRTTGLDSAVTIDGVESFDTLIFSQ